MNIIINNIINFASYNFNNMETAINNIKTILKEQKLSQADLADRCGMAVGTINRIIRGKQKLTQNTLKVIADALNVSIDELLENVSTLNNGVNGYLQFGNEITHITSYRSLLNWIKKYEPSIIGLPQMAKNVQKEEKRNQQILLNADFGDINFHKNETLDSSQYDCWSFRKSEDVREGIDIDLGNMCISYPFECNGRLFSNSEALYICGLFSLNSPQHIEIQEQLLNAKSGYDAKKGVRAVIAKHHKELLRKDWNSFNIEWMKWCVWQKVKKNNRFAEVLCSIPSTAYIIENSTHQRNSETSLFWGMSNVELEEKRAVIEKWVEMSNPTLSVKELDKIKMIERNKINHIGVWQGVNCMGKILKSCQLALLYKKELGINYDLLRAKHIYMFGELMRFEDELSTPKIIIFDWDMTLVDSTLAKQYGNNYREVQKHISEFSIFEGIKEVIEQLSEHHIIYVVSGNVGSTIKKVIQYLNLNIPLENVHGYRQGYPMENLARKKKVMQVALDCIIQTHSVSKSDILYIGDEADDYTVCQEYGVHFVGCLWGNNELKENSEVCTIDHPNEIFDIINLDGVTQ